MELRQHYALLLGLDDSWRVESVDLEVEKKRVEIRLIHAGGKIACPECGGPCGIADHAEERRWRHLDTMQFATEIVARLPRVRCPEHGVKTSEAPWAGKHSRFTLLFEAFAIDVLKACRTVGAAADLLGLSWDQVQSIVNRAVVRGLARRAATPIANLGLDEKSFGKGHDYVTVMTDLDGSRVLEVTPERTREAAETLLVTLSDEQRREVKAVAADMAPAYAAAVAATLPQADLVHDKFHVAKHLGEAVDKVRRAENKALATAGDDSLKGTRWLWLYALSKLTRAQRRRFEAVRDAELKTARAWGMKEQFRWFWRHVYRTSAESFFQRWYGWAIRSRLEPMKRAARMLRRHLPGLLNYFRHRITNAAAEGFNSVIQSLRYAARGFRNFANYRARILFFCGKLDLKP
ncbi:MAG TPA: ISL3 family transposase [Planctomycetia bacterium]|nr:ISL3 family transposase [Planctomycetia bacterium]